MEKMRSEDLRSNFRHKTLALTMKVALAHDFLIRWGGAERVLLSLHKIFPEAPIYTLFYHRQFVKEYFPQAVVKGSWLQRPYVFLRRFALKPAQASSSTHRLLAPFMAMAVESLDFSDYDLVISSTSAFMKGIIVPSKTKHLCYLHTPTRWAWQDFHHQAENIKHKDESRKIGKGLFSHLKSSILSQSLKVVSGRALIGIIKRTYIHFYRLWDFEAAWRPDLLIANSKYTAARIKKYYRRESKVIYPPGELPDFQSPIFPSREGEPETSNNQWLIFNRKKLEIKTQKNDYFIVVSRLSAYKKVDLVIEAFKELPYNLIIVGEGPEERKLKLKAKSEILNKKVLFTGFIKNKEKLRLLIKKSLALIHPTEEDFGLAIVEAMSLGKPVIAYEQGGAREIIEPGITGELFSSQVRSLQTITRKVAQKKNSYKSKEIRKRARKFWEEKFRDEIKKQVA